MDSTNRTCDKCKYIRHTEKQQEIERKNNNLVDHYCLLHRKRLFHYNTIKEYNEMIYPCNDCNFNDYISKQVTLNS